MPHVRSALLGLGLLACESEPVELPAPSYATFRAEVYPILVRDCGFARCHGDASRYFVVHGPGRARLDPTLDLFDPPSEDELLAAYQHARGMLASSSDVLDSPLLTKPLEGHAHAGRDRFGRNVWRDDEPALQLLEDWARGLR